MALTVKKITLWRGKVENRPGTLAEVLAPAAAARTDLKVVMGYREPGEAQAVIELFPVGGKKLMTGMASAGLGPSTGATLLVTGDEDILTGPPEADLMRQNIPSSEMKIIPRAGHYLPWEQPAEAGQLLRQFFDSVHGA